MFVQDQYEDLYEELPVVEQCEDCPCPNGCLKFCAIESYTQEDVAAVRGEA